MYIQSCIQLYYSFVHYRPAFTAGPSSIYCNGDEDDDSNDDDGGIHNGGDGVYNSVNDNDYNGNKKKIKTFSFQHSFNLLH